MLIMGLPFLLLVWTHTLAAIVFVVVVFVIGEMLWVPTSQAVVADLAPADIRGAYMGAFGSAPAIGFALAPLIGLQMRNSFGDEATWAMFAGIGGRRGGARRACARRSRPAGAPRAVCCTGSVRPEERDALLREDAPRVQTSRERRELAQLDERLRSSPLRGAPLPLRLRNFRPDARATLPRSAGRCRT